MKILKSILLVAFLYAVLGRLALFLALPPGYASPIWPAAGVALVFVLVYGYRVWPGIVLGSFCVNVWTSFDPSDSEAMVRSVLVSLCIAFGAALQAVFSAFLLKYFFPRQIKLTTFKEIGLFFLFGSVLGCVVNPSVGVATLVFSGTLPVKGCLINWLTWWIGDALGVFLFASITFVWISPLKEIWKSRRWILTCPLIVIFILILCVFYMGQKWSDDRIGLSLKEKSTAFTNILEQKMTEIYIALDSINGFYSSSEFVDREEFKIFVKAISKRVPELKSVAWVPRVLNVERNDYIERAKKDGLLDYQIKEVSEDGQVRLEGEKDVYFPIFYIEPMQGNEGALGLDNSSEKNRSQTLQNAVYADQLKASDTIILTQDKLTGLKSFLLISPVYKNGLPSRNVQDRRANLQGFLSVTARIQDVIDSILKAYPLENVHLTLRDRHSSDKEYLYVKDVKSPVQEKLNTQTLTINVAGRVWELTFSPTLVYYVSQQKWTLWFIIVGVFLFSGLFNVLLLIVTGQTIETTNLVAERTKELETSKLFLEEEVLAREDLVRQMADQAEDLKEQQVAMLNILDDSEKARNEAVVARRTVEETQIKIEENEKRLRLAVEGGRVGIWDWADVTQEKQWWSDQFYALLGYENKEISSDIETFKNLLHPEDRKRTLEQLESALQKKGDYDVVFRLKTKKTEFRWFSGRGEVSFDSDGNPLRVTGTIVDIHEEKKAREEFERSNKELEQFAYVASHDLQEPIRKIVGFTQLLQKDLGDKMTDRSKEFMSFVIDGAKRMQGLIQDLLQFSRVGRAELQLQPVSLNDVVKEALGILDDNIKEGNVVIECEDLPTLNVHKMQMVQLFQNLIGNGVKYRGEKDPFIKISVEEKGSVWEFSIKDNGIGFNPEFAEKIFIIFQRLHAGDEEYKGTGIGLAICKKIVERHEGRIWVETEEGKGTSFKFTLPRA